MNWAWATSLDQVLRSPAFPMWVTLAAAGFFGLVVLITMVRADKSAANGALTIITLLAVGVAVAATIDRFGPAGRNMTMPREARQMPASSVSLPALACIEDLAGDTVLTACEKDLFSSAEITAAAVSYAASEIERLTTYGDVASANQDMTPELMSLRQAVERDRYGLVAHILTERYRCTPADCVVFRAISNRRQIVANMEARTYDGLIARYAASWNAPQSAAQGLASAASAPGQPAPGTPLAAQGSLVPPQGPLGSSVLVARPTNAEFPTAASTPPVSIMNPEPGTGTRPPKAAAPPPASAAAPPASAPAAAAAKKPPAPPPPAAPKQARAAPPAAPQAPVQISPEASAPPAVARE
jgi:hypothetical protein